MGKTKGNKNNDKENNELDREKRIEETGQVSLNNNEEGERIHLLTIIGEIEGHENLSGTSKTTKYEHILPALAAIEDSKDIQGVLVLIHTMGGDVEAGLAIAEMLSSLSKPTVSLVLGGSHSIGLPIAVSTNYSFIVPTGTMVIHPVRVNGTVIGSPQTFDYFRQIQARITGFVCDHCKISKERFEELFLVCTFIIAFLLSVVLVIIQKQRYTQNEILYGILLGIPNYFSARFLLINSS